jgi:eukaryotic-like serine/threonine-protein kinase
MALAAGTKLGPYEILAPIGAGGMGEVYRARDPRVGRDVAIKVSSEQFSDRFAREIHTVAALNHSNVCTLYDVGSNYLVMELIEGPTLADRIKQGAIPLEESLAIARQIADALEAAHEKGIVHRDLKPRNIKIRPDGTVKVLDFGLAKVEETAAVSLETSPTLSVAQTAAGVLLGTAAYMSPEQARGKAVDKRADIWAFGVVLYEMLTGTQLFTGETVSDTLAEVLKQEPDWDKVPAMARPLVRRCIERDPKKRLRDIGDAWQLLENAPQSAAAKRSRFAWIWAAVATLLVIALAVPAFRSFRGEETSEEIVFQVSAPFMPHNGVAAISPDGRAIAFTASSSATNYLFVRKIGSVALEQISGTEGAILPFWSPDSRSIAFLAGGKIKRVEVSGGPPRDICTWPSSPPIALVGTWSKEGVIVCAKTNGPLYCVSADGGEPTEITRLDKSQKELGHLHPSFLPDGRHYLYTVVSGNPSKNGIYIGSLDSQERMQLLAGASLAAYAEPGYLLFHREGTLFARPFSATKRTFAGEEIRIADNIAIDSWGWAAFSVSQNGILIYRSAGVQGKSRFAWFDRSGKQLQVVGEPGVFVQTFSLSPDGKRIVVLQKDDAWLMEWERNAITRLTYDSAPKTNVVWSPDGLQIGFTSSRNGTWNMFLKKVSGIGEETAIVESEVSKFISDWSPDGRYIAYSSIDSGNAHLYALPLFGDRKPLQIVQLPSSQDACRFSFDGKWVAYHSDESGSWQVYVSSFPAGDLKRQVSINGGAQPRWRRDGKELYYFAPDGKMMAVDIRGGATIDPGIPHGLFNIEFNIDPVEDWYSVTPDGQRFLLRKPLAESTSMPITVVLNWTALLKK